jgi:uracil phosphoribosyltransferase
VTAATNISLDRYLGRNIQLLPQTPQLRALHTTIRDRDVPREQFVFYADRIIRMLLEAALGLLPFEPRQVRTPVGRIYNGLRFADRICGVSVMRAGESMEAGLRAVVPSVRIGKILIQRDKATVRPHLYFSALPNDIADRHVLLLEPMLATGGTARMAVRVLLDRGVAEDRIVFVNLLMSPAGATALCDAHPVLRLVTSSIEEGLNENAYMVPGIGDFGDRYFGTDR